MESIVDVTDSFFQSMDLDFQLHQWEITKVVTAGLMANACLEMIARCAYEF